MRGCFRLNTAYNLSELSMSQLPARKITDPKLNYKVQMALKYGNKVANNKLVQAYYLSSTLSNVYIYPILMQIFQNKVLVLVIMAFII